MVNNIQQKQIANQASYFQKGGQNFLYGQQTNTQGSSRSEKPTGAQIHQ